MLCFENHVQFLIRWKETERLVLKFIFMCQSVLTFCSLDLSFCSLDLSLIKFSETEQFRILFLFDIVILYLSCHPSLPNSKWECLCPVVDPFKVGVSLVLWQTLSKWECLLSCGRPFQSGSVSCPMVDP